MDIDLRTRITLEALNTTYSKHQLPETFGIRYTKIGKDFLEGTLTVDERHLRPGKMMNGGVSLVLIETLGSMSSACWIDTEVENPLGIQVNASHLAIAYPGDTLTATSEAVHVGKRTHIWDVTVKNQKGKLVSSGRITLLITKK